MHEKDVQQIATLGRDRKDLQSALQRLAKVKGTRPATSIRIDGATQRALPVRTEKLESLLVEELGYVTRQMKILGVTEFATPK
jgi:hypothetical protein